MHRVAVASGDKLEWTILKTDLSQPNCFYSELGEAIMSRIPPLTLETVRSKLGPWYDRRSRYASSNGPIRTSHMLWEHLWMTTRSL
jgi:hypothetical protein